MFRIAQLAQCDLPKLERFLNQRMHQAMFMLSNLHSAGFEDRGGARNGVYVGAFEGNDLVGAACHYRLGNLILCAPKAVEEIVKVTIHRSRRPIKAIVGPEDQVNDTIDHLGLHKKSTTCDERESLYRLLLSQLQVPTALARDIETSKEREKVHGRVLAANDVDTVADWTLRYRIETLGDDDTELLRTQIREGTLAAVDRGDVWVLDHHGKLVAKTAFNAEIPSAVQIGGVWTPHALRGRGYGRCVVASHLLDAQFHGRKTAVLFVGDQNRPAQQAYRALGFRSVGRYRVVIFRDAAKVVD